MQLTTKRESMHSNMTPPVPNPRAHYLFSNRALLYLIVPLIIDLFLTFFVGMLDGVMVSGVSEGAVSAISLVDQIMQLVIMLFSAMAAGGTVVAGQYLGAKKKTYACQSTQQLVWLMFLTGVALCLLLLLFRHAILNTVFGSITREVYVYADRYLVITAFSIPMLAVHQAGTAVFRTMGNARNPMLISLMMNVLNFSGNAAFIYGLGLNTDGAGFSTLISRTAAALVVTILLCNPSRTLHYERTLHYRPDPVLIRKVLCIGVPGGIENGMFQLGKILLLSLVSLYGTVAITANAITQTMAGLQLIPALAINMAITTVIARCVGLGDLEQVRYYSRKLLRTMFFTVELSAWLIFFLMPIVLRLYHASPETSALTMTMMRWHTIGAITLWPFAFGLSQSLRATGDVRFTLVISLITMWGIRILGAYLLARHLGLGAVAPWIAMVLDFVFRTVFYQWRWASERWTEKRVI